ncbi:MAG: hypothetical protein RM347_018390 [Nostoc sp. ChiQUE02]|uniref:hypothetical protein n=1 Tax=Nostoc sp. ChiQUE02 TaxID=3075377 RepID=UPI002AD4C225|nr:hypothetical protein [Nostoc sp. ChiQUE02]MDZ8230662.1 hypothetical protein [Nostoc sp. ChiQUE02]
MNEEIIEQWRNQQKTGRKGASNYFRQHVAVYADVLSGVTFSLHEPQAVFARWDKQIAISTLTNRRRYSVADNRGKTVQIYLKLRFVVCQLQE